MRPKYESKQDRINQRAVASEVVATRPGSRWTEFPTFHVVDFAVWRGDDMVGLIEVKCRSCPSDEYPDYAISEAKWLKMIEEGRAQGVPVFLVVRFTDKTIWMPVTPGRYRVYRGGRRDRNDKRDVEPMVHIPWKAFRPMRSPARSAGLTRPPKG